MSQFITWKFGLESDSISSVREIFLKFRDFENQIITKLLSQVNIPDFIKVFKEKAKTGYKIAYDFFNINKLASQTYLGITFKERMKHSMVERLNLEIGLHITKFIGFIQKSLPMLYKQEYKQVSK